MKLAIIGTRTPSLSYTEWETRLKGKINLDNVTLIVSGGAKGIDTYAKIFAARHHIPLMEFLPQYATYGKNAPLVRNRQIMKEATFFIAFPNKDSRGNYQAIREAEKLHRDGIVVMI